MCVGGGPTPTKGLRELEIIICSHTFKGSSIKRSRPGRGDIRVSVTKVTYGVEGVLAIVTFVI